MCSSLEKEEKITKGRVVYVVANAKSNFRMPYLITAAIVNPDLSCDFEDPDQCGWKADLTKSNQFSRQHRLDDLDNTENVTGTSGNYCCY